MKFKFPVEIRGMEIKTFLIFPSDCNWGENRVSPRLEEMGIC